MTYFAGSLAHFSGDLRELGPVPCRLMTDLGYTETLQGESGDVQPAGNIFGNIELRVPSFALYELLEHQNINSHSILNRTELRTNTLQSS
jgi:hypothetical protein